MKKKKVEGGLNDEEYERLQDDIKQTHEKAHRNYGYGQSGNKKNLEILSVEQMLRKDSGRYGVRGMIVGVSPVEHVVYSTQFGCSVCIKKARRKGEKDGSYERIHDPPLFSLPYDLRLNKVNKCPECEEPSFGPKNHKEKAVVRIYLQDESKQNNLENLTVIVFESDT